MSARFPEPLAGAVATTQDLVEPEMRKAVSRLDPGMHRICSYHLGWTYPDGAPADGSPGKSLRPTLVLLSAQACGGDPAAAVPAAVAVELVHNFSLLHDDVMDGDRRRRHRPTAWTIFGVPAAILAGDAMLALALELVVRPMPRHPRAVRRLPALLLDTVTKLIAGQSADMDFERRPDVGLADGLAMSDGKTGALLRCSAACGAVTAGAPLRDVELLGRFGGHLGMAFQLVDDLLGIWGAPEVTGKPALADLRNRKKSLPVLAALRDQGPAGDRLRTLFERQEPFTEDELPIVAETVELAGGREWAQRRADQEAALAHRCLARQDPDPALREALLALADYVTRRDR